MRAPASWGPSGVQPQDAGRVYPGCRGDTGPRGSWDADFRVSASILLYNWYGCQLCGYLPGAALHRLSCRCAFLRLDRDPACTVHSDRRDTGTCLWPLAVRPALWANPDRTVIHGKPSQISAHTLTCTHGSHMHTRGSHVCTHTALLSRCGLANPPSWLPSPSAYWWAAPGTCSPDHSLFPGSPRVSPTRPGAPHSQATSMSVDDG